jgi:sRNA-binding carbon storage regulator CsrA
MKGLTLLTIFILIIGLVITVAVVTIKWEQEKYLREAPDIVKIAPNRISPKIPTNSLWKSSQVDNPIRIDRSNPAFVLVR